MIRIKSKNNFQLEKQIKEKLIGIKRIKIKFDQKNIKN